MFWVTPLHDHHPVLNGLRTTTARRTALAVVMQSMSLPCPGPFTSNLSDLACNVMAFLAAVAFEYLQLIGNLRPEEQAWVQAWRGPPMQRRLEPRVREVLAAG